MKLDEGIPESSAMKANLDSRVSRRLSVLLIFAALTCFIAGGYLCFRGLSEKKRLVVDAPARVLNGLVAGGEYELEFRVRNRTSSVLRLVGGPCSA
jgi:hypothetical protein